MLNIDIQSGVIYCLKQTINGEQFQFNKIFTGNINDAFEVADNAQSVLELTMSQNQSLLVPNKVTSLKNISSPSIDNRESPWKPYLQSSLQSKICFGFGVKARCNKVWNLTGDEDINGNIIGKLDCKLSQVISSTVSFNSVTTISGGFVSKLDFYWTDEQFCITYQENDVVREWIANSHPAHLLIPNFYTPDKLWETGSGKFAFKTCAQTAGSPIQLKVAFTNYGTRTYVLPGYIPGSTQFNVPNEDPDMTGTAAVEYLIDYIPSRDNNAGSQTGIYKLYVYTPGSYNNNDSDSENYEIFVKC